MNLKHIVTTDRTFTKHISKRGLRIEHRNNRLNNHTKTHKLIIGNIILHLDNHQRNNTFFTKLIIISGPMSFKFQKFTRSHYQILFSNRRRYLRRTQFNEFLNDTRLTDIFIAYVDSFDHITRTITRSHSINPILRSSRNTDNNRSRRIDSDLTINKLGIDSFIDVFRSSLCSFILS